MNLDKRVAYYTRKVAEYGATHVSERRNPFRYDRLMKYKARLNELANTEKA